MIVFHTAIRHPDSSKDYRKLWRVLNASLFSLCCQKNKNFRVVVVCNRRLPLEHEDRILRNTDFVEIDFPCPPNNSRKETLLDKPARFAVGAIYARRYSPRFLMPCDFDDFFHQDLVDFLESKRGREVRTGWLVAKGWVYVKHRIAQLDHFSSHCGSCNIYKSYVVYDGISKGLSVRSRKEQLLESMDPKFRNRVIAVHSRGQQYVSQVYKEKLNQLPFRAVMYHCGHGENISTNRDRKWYFSHMRQKGWFYNPKTTRPISDEIRDTFHVDETILYGKPAD